MGKAFERVVTEKLQVFLDGSSALAPLRLKSLKVMEISSSGENLEGRLCGIDTLPLPKPTNSQASPPKSPRISQPRCGKPTHSSDCVFLHLRNGKLSLQPQLPPKAGACGVYWPLTNHWQVDFS